MPIRLKTFEKLYIQKHCNLKLLPTEAYAIIAVDKRIGNLISRQNHKVEDDIIVGMGMFVASYIIRIKKRKVYDLRIVGEEAVGSIVSHLKDRIEEKADSTQVFSRIPELEAGIEFAQGIYVDVLKIVSKKKQ